MMEVDVLIKRGRVIDAASNVDKIADLAIKNGLVYSVGENLAVQAKETYDAAQCLVVPGLVDIHVHAYQHCTPLGINVDEICLNRGVTTVVDAGSAGSSTFPGFRHFIAERSRTNIFALVNIAAHGLAAAGCAGHGLGGENDSLNQVTVDSCVDCVRENRDLVVGVKVRLTADVCNDGENEEEVYLRALDAADRAGVPLMVHHAFSTIPTKGSGNMVSCPGNLHSGDVYTHCFHGFPGTVIDVRQHSVLASVFEAQNRGILFDVGHGMRSFSWTVAEMCARESFWPDLISTDLHRPGIEMYEDDLLNVMTKMLHVGMPLVYIIRAVTASPAKAIGRLNVAGTLAEGMPADVAVLKIQNCNRRVPDSQSQIRHVTKEFTMEAVWKNGEAVAVREPNHDYSNRYFYEQAKDWPRLLVHDECPPCPVADDADESNDFLKTI